jgi:hypothetical protein
MKPLQKDVSPEMYIALEVKQEDPLVLQSLTTDVMQWSEDVWIMDLSRYYKYWLKQAEKTGLGVLGLWRKLFNHLLGEEAANPDSHVIALAPSYRACCARNPWSAVLLLQIMRQKDVKGLVSLQGRFGQSLFRSIPWATWWGQINVIETHFLDTKIKGFKQAGFRQQCKRLQLAVPRLDFKHPWEMGILSRQGVKKRFGEILANIWNWSYDAEPERPQTIYQSRFPWKSRRFAEPPIVRRNLDYPLLLWEQFSPLLVEDFDKLCLATKNNGRRVTRIEWTLTFENMNELTVPICFRNPHNLQEEKERHLTSLLQANYGFTETITKAFPPDSKNGHYETMPLVLAWELRITGSLYLPDVVLDIFGEGQEKGKELDVLLRLENELPVQLSRFSPRGDWFPEDSFAPEHFEAEEIVSETPEIQRSLEALAEERPLFIRSKPLMLEQMGKNIATRFLESTMGKWWKVGNAAEKERHYFKHIDPEGNALWVFRDTAGQWYQHGIFG